jgi:Domain of unknown function (DUF5615)
VRLCLDEMYSPQIAVALREAGHDVDCAKERPELQNLPDEELLSVMTQERRALLTENASDFRPIAKRLAAENVSHYGLVFSSNSSMPRGKGTIGLYMHALSDLLQRHPGDDDLVDQEEWLSPES